MELSPTKSKRKMNHKISLFDSPEGAKGFSRGRGLGAAPAKPGKPPVSEQKPSLAPKGRQNVRKEIKILSNIMRF